MRSCCENARGIPEYVDEQRSREIERAAVFGAQGKQNSEQATGTRQQCISSGACCSEVRTPMSYGERL
jgi:hypothetical protein